LSKIQQRSNYCRVFWRRAVTIGPDGPFYVLLQNPTGAGTGLGLATSTPGMVIRLVPAAQK
jgi:hypothetical protein